MKRWMIIGIIIGLILLTIGILLYNNRDYGITQEIPAVTIIELPQDTTIEFLHTLPPEKLKEIRTFNMSSRWKEIGVKEFPPIISELVNLENLYCGGNNISDLTPIKNLIHLQIINLEDNDVADWKEFENLTNLSKLYISGNRLSDLKGIEKLKKLIFLDLTRNHNLSDISGIEMLTNLEYLKLGSNSLETFPDSFYTAGLPIKWLEMTGMHNFDYSYNLPKFHQLKNLQELYLYEHYIPKLNIDFEKCDKLETFNLYWQKKIDIADVLKRISKAPNLKYLGLINNNIRYLPENTVLPDSLKGLDLSVNNIKKLPVGLTKYINLKTVILRGNPIDTIAMKKIEKEMVNTKFYYDK